MFYIPIIQNTEQNHQRVGVLRIPCWGSRETLRMMNSEHSHDSKTLSVVTVEHVMWQKGVITMGWVWDKQGKWWDIKLIYIDILYTHGIKVVDHAISIEKNISSLFPYQKKKHNSPEIHIVPVCTLWFNISMGNYPFIDGLSIKNGDFPCQTIK